MSSSEGAETLLVLRKDRVIRRAPLRDLPLQVGASAECPVQLEVEGVPPVLGELRRSPQGSLRLHMSEEAVAHRLRPGIVTEVGELGFLVVPLAASGGREVLEPLLDLVPRLWEPGDAEASFTAVLDALRRGLGAEWGALVRREGEEVDVVSTAGRERTAGRAPVSRTVLTRLDESQGAVVADVVSEHSELEMAASIPTEVRSVLAARLLHGEAAEEVGVLYLESPVTRSSFSDDERLLFERICDFVAFQLARVREGRELEKKAERLEALHRAERARAMAEGPPVANAPSMQEAMDEVDRAATTSSTVLLLGESGTGKEVLARRLHEEGPRAERPFVAVNCAAIPERLFESELFGHLEGSFSGATRDRIGRFEMADGGTLFLDEVGDMPLPLQAKLLRALEEGEVQPVGATESRKVDVRVVAATNVDLAARVGEGKFREDLYYRIAVVVVRIPPLRERLEDIVPLAERFTELFCRRHHRPADTLSPAAAAVLQAHGWPGNVRELRNAVEQAVIREDGDELTPASFALALRAPEQAGDDSGETTLEAARNRFERALIDAALRRHSGDVDGTRKELGISRAGLYARCKELGLKPADYRGAGG